MEKKINLIIVEENSMIIVKCTEKLWKTLKKHAMKIINCEKKINYTTNL